MSKTNHPQFDDFHRKYAEDTVSVPSFQFTECRDINMAVVIPSVVVRGEESVIINKSWTSGNLEIALYSGDVKKKVLYNGYIQGGSDGLGGIFLFKWDGNDPDGLETYSGDYKIRWTLGNDYREFPIYVTIQTNIEDSDNITAPESYDIMQNYPNPFNPETRIRFSLEQGSYVTLNIYDVLGRHIRTLKDGYLPAAEYIVTWDGRDDNGRMLSSGVYFYRLSVNQSVSSKKMILLK